MSAESSAVHGFIASGFEAVGAAFERAFEGAPGMGAALAIRMNGVTVVDLWGGIADARVASPWVSETSTVVFSCTKGVMSLLAARLAEDGLLDYDAPVAQYWPEFAAEGKGAVLVRHLLAHRAGLSAPRRSVSTAEALDWSTMTALLAAQRPLWEPGAGYAYHALTHGWLIGEVMRRITGESPSALVRRLLSEPLGVDFHVGLPVAEHGAVAHLVVGDSLRRLVADQAAVTTGAVDWPGRAMTLGAAFPPALVGEDAGFNVADVRAAEIPGAGGIGSARALAAIWSSAVVETDGVAPLRADTIERLCAVETEGRPVFEATPPFPRWGLGVQLDSDARRFVTSRGFGHDGAGGQVAFAEPDLGMGFAFVTNLMEAGPDARATRIVDALRDVVDAEIRSGEGVDALTARAI